MSAADITGPLVLVALFALPVLLIIVLAIFSDSEVHIFHKWQGGAREETDVYGAGTRHPVRTLYHQWFKCSECGREKLKKIGVKK